jgi:signal transduction histidine kinase/phage shock protein PspC (stress-responsive transcriptional regulator)
MAADEVSCEHLPMDEPHRDRSWRLPRSGNDRVLLGVAGGIGERIGVDPLVIRLGFVLLTLAGGVGFVCYLIGVIVTAEPDGAATPRVRPAGGRRTVAVVLILTGVLLILRSMQLWLGDAVVLPVALAVSGSMVLWTRATLGRSRLAQLLSRSSTGEVRFVAGTVLVVVSLASFVVVGRRSGLLSNAPALVAAIMAVLAVVVGPWVIGLVREVRDERRERIRSEERATLAAHLHDSVLQTLALIQRSDDPKRTSSLARTQERELRGWLYGRAPLSGPATVASGIEDLVDQVERAHGVPVESVTVGDAPLDEAATALLGAAREALVNAARHSGAGAISMFVEVEDGSIEAFVRDQGAGFDRAAVAPDRRGIADSIEGRVERVGGQVAIASSTGRGTEVRLRVPRDGS